MSDVGEMVAWLRAQVEADKAAAEAALPGPWFPNDECDEVMSEGLCGGDDILVCEGFALSNRQLRATVRHIVLHDPDDVIADADAKLAILDEHATTKTYAVGEGMRRVKIAVCVTCRNRHGVPCATVRLLALGYRHRPGWQPHWTA